MLHVLSRTAVLLGLISAAPVPAASQENIPPSSSAGSRDLSVEQLLPPRPTGRLSASFAVSLLPIGSSSMRIGEAIGFKIATTRAGFAHLYVMDASGKTQVWLQNVRLQARSPLLYPPTGQVIRATAPAGNERVLLLVTRQRMLGFTGPATTTAPFDPQLTREGFRQALSAQVDTLPRRSWAFTETVIRVND